MIKKAKKVISKPLCRLASRILFNFDNDSKYTPVEFTDKEKKILIDIFGKRLTMTSPQRLAATMLACKYVVENSIAGDFVECGVWRGGNALAAKLTFELYGSDKVVYLLDTFAGMTEPTDADYLVGKQIYAKEQHSESQRESHNEWAYASLDEVRRNFKDAHVDMNNVRFIQGDVLDTLKVKDNMPDVISVLRLDTDWYESTKTEMNVLYPLIAAGGVLIVDDYGHWDGARKAIEEYFVQNREKISRPLLQCIDYTGRMAVKL